VNLFSTFVPLACAAAVVPSRPRVTDVNVFPLFETTSIISFSIVTKKGVDGKRAALVTVNEVAAFVIEAFNVVIALFAALSLGTVAYLLYLYSFTR
jgi:alanine-alpha-ketoisovalerate/valine-pyruvate aminotransferase